MPILVSKSQKVLGFNCRSKLWLMDVLNRNLVKEKLFASSRPSPFCLKPKTNIQGKRKYYWVCTRMQNSAWRIWMIISFLFCKVKLATLKRTSKSTNYNWPARNTFCLWQVASYIIIATQWNSNHSFLVIGDQFQRKTVNSGENCEYINDFYIHRKFYPPIIGCYCWNDITRPTSEQRIRRFKEHSIQVLSCWVLIINASQTSLHPFNRNLY